MATKKARSMVTRYGISETIGMVNYDSNDDEVFIGRDLAHTKNFSESVASKIDDEVRKIIDDCYDKAKNLLNTHQSVLHECANRLIQKERIGREEFESLFVVDNRE